MKDGLQEETASSKAEFLSVVSVFSGAGGLDLGFEQAGLVPLLALDVDGASVETYNRNRSHRGRVARTADLSREDPGTIVAMWRRFVTDGRPSGLIGGPPCQAFSAANVHKTGTDPRHGFLLYYATLLKEFHGVYGLDFFVFENVTGLMRRPHLSLLAEFMCACGEAGFEVCEPIVLDALRFGVPQHRKRMFIVGFAKDNFPADEFVAPQGNGVVRTVGDALHGLPEPAFFARGIRPTDFGLHPNHWCMNPRSMKFKLGQNEAKTGRSFRILEWDKPSPTVAYGHREVHVHPCRRRRLSVYEAMRLQGFPPEYELRGTLSDQIRQVSDAVPPPLASALALAIAEFLAEHGTARTIPTFAH